MKVNKKQESTLARIKYMGSFISANISQSTDLLVGHQLLRRAEAALHIVTATAKTNDINSEVRRSSDSRVQEAFVASKAAEQEREFLPLRLNFSPGSA